MHLLPAGKILLLQPHLFEEHLLATSGFEAAAHCSSIRGKKLSASAGSRTRIDCLEGNHANRYTTDASLYGMIRARRKFLIQNHWAIKVCISLLHVNAFRNDALHCMAFDC